MTSFTNTPSDDGTSPAAHLSGWRASVVIAAHRLESWIGKLCQGILLITGLFMLVVLTVIVVLRYGEIGTIDSGAELCSLTFPIFVMAGMVEAARIGAHVATQILLNALNDRWRIFLVVLIHLVTASVYFHLAWYAYQNAIIAHDELSTVLQVPGSMGYGCLAAGLAFIGICSVAAIVRHTLANEKVVVNLADAGPGVV